MECKECGRSWHNNIINKKLNTDCKKDFSICDLDGVVRCHYASKTRLIIYESKFANEKAMGNSQRLTLSILANNIDWTKFDNYSGLYVLKIYDIENDIRWYDINYKHIRTTNFKELYEIFSCKV